MPHSTEKIQSRTPEVATEPISKIFFTIMIGIFNESKIKTILYLV